MSYAMKIAKTGKRPHFAEGFGTLDEAEAVAAKMEKPGYSVTITELTPAGEQHVIPGCERNASPKASQLDLFG